MVPMRVQLEMGFMPSAISSFFLFRTYRWFCSSSRKSDAMMIGLAETSWRFAVSSVCVGFLYLEQFPM